MSFLYDNFFSLEVWHMCNYLLMTGSPRDIIRIFKINYLHFFFSYCFQGVLIMQQNNILYTRMKWLAYCVCWSICWITNKGCCVPAKWRREQNRISSNEFLCCFWGVVCHCIFWNWNMSMNIYMYSWSSEQIFHSRIGHSNK